jgi:hypothetical protein
MTRVNYRSLAICQQNKIIHSLASNTLPTPIIYKKNLHILNMVISNEAITILIFIYIVIVNVHFNRVKRRPYLLDTVSSLTLQSNKGRQL